MTQRPPTRLAPAWLLYLDHRVGGIALDASATGGLLAPELSSHFSEVRVLRADDPHVPIVDSILNAPWTDHTFDCIAVHDRFAGVDPKAAETVEALERIRALLRPDGWFVGASLNPSHFAHPRSERSGLSPAVFSRVLLDARFREVRRVFAMPSFDRPLTLIPDATRAVRAFEAFDAISGLSKWTRRAVAGLRLHALLYPAYFILARA